MRPLGAIFLGFYGDRYGRRAALTLTIWLMVVGTAMIAFAPSYQAVGLISPIIVIIARLLQGTPVLPIAHLTCVGASREDVEEVISDFLDAGVRSFLALRGDPPKDQPDWRPAPDGVRSSIELVALLIFLVEKWRTQPRLLLGACGLSVIGVWIEKGMGLIIPGFVPTPLGEIFEYRPSLNEVMVALGIWAVGLLIFTVLAKVSIPIELGRLTGTENSTTTRSLS